MKRSYQKSELKINEKKSWTYCGIDHHKNTSYICILDNTGKEILTKNINSDGVVSFLENYKDLWIGIEMSGGVQYLTDRLEERGHKVTIINPVQFRAIGVGGKKNDKKDAEAIAKALWIGYIPEVFKRSKYSRQMKSLLMSRDMVVTTRVCLTNHVRGILREYGIKIEQGAGAFWEEVQGKLAEVESGIQVKVLQNVLDMAVTLKNSEAEIEQLIRDLVKEDARVEQLQTVPGVGFLTAVAFLAIIDDPSRFKSAKQIGSYLGLVPRENSSGGRRRMGSITRCGSELLRKFLVQGARAVMQRDPKENSDRVHKWANNVKSRAGGNKAVVAMAHKKAMIMFAMLRDGSTFSMTGRSVIKIKKAA